MIKPGSRPRLAPKVRLRFDRHSQRHMLVYPDKGMVLNPSAAAIAELCTGEHTFEAIVERLCTASGGASREQVERDARTFLEALSERALIRVEE